MKNLDKVLVLGAGKMVQAIMLGLKDSVDLSNWQIYSPSGESARKLAQLTGAQHITDLNSYQANWVILGCKPQQLISLKEKIGDQFKEATFISLLAALPEASQLNVLGAKKLIRVMPNLPVRFKAGVSLVASESANTGEVQALFAHLGFAELVSESELEELTLLTGSGPAFFYEFTQHLAQSFTSLDPVRREVLARAVLSGAARSSSEEKLSLQELVNAVTSKGGVTIAVLEWWRSLNFAEYVKSGIKAGKIRSEELKSLLPRN